MPSAREGELGTLCQSCGLCCDGSLFGCVTLAPDEVDDARIKRLRVLPRGNAFEQRCSALATEDDRCVCAIYTDRPRACRAFTCRLYEQHRREGGPIEARLEVVSRVRELLRIVEETSDEEVRRVAVKELTERMEDNFARG